MDQNVSEHIPREMGDIVSILVDGTEKRNSYRQFSTVCNACQI